MSRLRAGVLVLTVALAGACGDAENDADDYTEALVDASDDQLLSEDENTCFARATVDAVGVEALDDATSPGEIRDRGITDLVALGVEVSEEDGERFYADLRECADLRHVVVLQALGTADVAPEVRACLDRELNDDLVESLFVTSFLGRDTAEVLDEIEAAFGACVPNR